MLQRTCIVLISLLCSFSSLGRAMLNLTLPGQHPNPEAVVQEVHRYILAQVLLFLCLWLLPRLIMWTTTQFVSFYVLGFSAFCAFQLSPTRSGPFCISLTLSCVALKSQPSTCFFLLQEGKCFYSKKGNATSLSERPVHLPNWKPHRWLLEMWPKLGQQPTETSRLCNWVWSVRCWWQEWWILHGYWLLRWRCCQS